MSTATSGSVNKPTAATSGAATGASASASQTAAGAKASTATGASAGSTSSARGSTGATSGKGLQAQVHTLEFAWFVTHVFVLLDTLLLLFFRKWSKFSFAVYRGLFLSAIAGFGIIAKQKYAGTRVNARQLLADDNIHYLGLSALWLVTPRRFLSPLPFAIFSLFHVLTYARSFLLPALGHPVTSTYSVQIERFVKTYNDKFTFVAAYIELAILAQVALQFITFRRGSFIPFVVYLVFYRLRYAVSGYTRSALKTVEIRLDHLAGNPNLPPVVKEVWITAKNVVASLPGPAVASSPAASTARATR